MGRDPEEWAKTKLVERVCVCVCVFSNLNYPEFHPTMRLNTQTHGLFNRIILDVLPHGWPLQGIQTTDTSVNL